MKILRKIAIYFQTIVLSNTDNSWSTTIPTTADYTLVDVTHIDSDLTPVVLPAMTPMVCTPISPDGWYRAKDWLPIAPLVIDGEQKAVLLVAVYNNVNPDGDDSNLTNYMTVVAAGNYTVDWGDGSVVNYASGVQAEHLFSYASMPASSYCTRGYRQAVITITPQIGNNLTSLNFGKRHSAMVYSTYTNPILDSHISGTNITNFKFYDNGSNARVMEHCHAYQSTNSCTTLSSTWYNCYSLQSLDVSSWNVSNVTTLASTWQNCYSLKSLDLSTWDVSNLIYLYYAWQFCYSLQSLDISAWNVSNVTSLAGAWYACSSLQSLDVSAWNVSNVTTLFSTWQGCHSLQSLDVSAWDVSNVTILANAWAYCYLLRSIDVSSWDVSNVTTLGYTYYYCSSLRGILTPASSACTDYTAITTNTTSLASCVVNQIGRTFTIANNKLSATALNAAFTALRDLNGSIGTSIRTTGNYGTGYAVGDLIQLNAGNNDARIKVLTVSSGAVVTYQLMIAGTGYTVVGALTTTAITGVGVGLKIDVTALVAAQTITITGNTGAATCNQTIATAKNWIVIN